MYLPTGKAFNKLFCTKNSLGGKGRMAKFTVQSGASVEDFFVNCIPAQFNEAVSGADVSSLAGKEIHLQFKVSDSAYCLKIKDGKSVEVIKGDAEKPLLALALSDQVFLDALSGKYQGLFDRFIDPVEISDPVKLKNLMDTKGALNLSLTKDGNDIPMSMVFNGEAKPCVDICLELKDWIALQNREVSGQTLFMNGKLKFSGDLGFLMRLQTLM